VPLPSSIPESFLRDAAPWAAYLGFLVSAGVPGFLGRLPWLLRDALILVFYGVSLTGFGIRNGAVGNRSTLLLLGLLAVAFAALRLRLPRKPPEAEVPDRRLWTWVLAGAWPVLMGLATLLDLLHADLRRAETRAAEEAASIAPAAAATFQRPFLEPAASASPARLSLPLDEWRDSGANRMEPPEWWLAAAPGLRLRWEQAAAVPLSSSTNPWVGFPATEAGPEASAVAHFLEVRHGIRSGTFPDPVTELERVREAAPNVRTPAGLPVSMLAWRELFRLPKPADARHGSALRGAFLQDFRHRPAVLWPSVRESLQSGWAVGDADWEKVVETLRRLESETPWREAVARGLARNPKSGAFWVGGPDGRRLFWSSSATGGALRPSGAVGEAVGTLFPEQTVRSAFRAASELPGLRAGSGWGIRFRIGDETWNAVGASDSSDWKSLASAPLFPGAEDGSRVEVGLAEPAAYFASVRRQVAWSGSLGAAAAVAVIAALFLGRRAFLRLQDLTEAQTNFVAGVTHELRAPLASVRLLAENLQRGGDASAERRREYYDLIVRECRRLGTLVQNVLDWSRIERGRREYEPRPTDLPALVSETARILEPQFAPRRVRLVLRLPEPAPDSASDLVDADPDAVQQCLVNLLDNALKHAPEDSEVVLALERGADAWALSVADSGPGIPESEHRRIFDRFHRLGSELRRETEGIGIGLSIVKHIVEGHRGTVRVESHPGRGARFVVTLPVARKGNTIGGTP